MAEFEILDRREEIEKIDRGGMLRNVEQFPEMLLQALAQDFVLPKIRNISQILILGVGGSAIAGDIVSDFLSGKLEIPILVNRSYFLPAFVGKGTLIFALSYSGNTEEVLFGLREAEKREAAVVAIASGGKLKEVAESKGFPFLLLPSGYQPRAALPYLLVKLLVSLEKLGFVQEVSREISSAAAFLQRLREEYGMQRPVRNNLVKQLAKKTLDKIPIIFGSAGTTAAAALRWKTQFSENSKTTALLNIFPELNHNEIVNLSGLKREEHNFIWLVLRDDGDHERVKKRIEITKSLIGRQLGGANEVFSQGKSLLTRILSLILFGDYLSVYLAILRGVDPTPVEIITRLKKELTR